MVAMTPSRALNGAPFIKFPSLLIAQLSCSQVISQVNFCPSEDGSPRDFGDNSCICRNENALATLAYCYQTGYPQEIESFINMCNRDYNTSLNQGLIDAALEKYYTAAKELNNSSHLRYGIVVDFPVKLSSFTIFLYKKSYDQFLGNYNRSIDYGWYMVVYMMFVFTLAAIGNWSKLLGPKLVKKFTGPILRWTRSRITLPALSGTERTKEKHLWKVFGYLPPTRAETLALGSFSLLALHLCFYKIHFVQHDPIFGTKLAAYMRYFGVRSGIIASSLLPLSVLFAGRNNILQWFTRWEYSTFVMFHRWISRIMVLLVIVHSVGYSKNLKFPPNHMESYIIFGVAGTVSGLAILVQGLLVLRRKWYEAFLAIHIILAAAFLIGAWLHVKDFRFVWYYYVSACLWMLDRVIRIQRLCVFGFPLARVQLYEDDTLKFRVSMPPGFHAVGGGHCFVHFLRWSCFWQSHPFTYTVVNGDIVFYVKVKKGVTESLKRYLEENPSISANMRVAIEGSYGEATPALRYDTSVFIAGGNGIPGIFAEAVEVAEYHKGHRKVKLIWAVREYKSLLWFYDELQDLAKLDIETEIYISRPHSNLCTSVSDKLVLLENTYTHRSYQSTEAMEDPIQKIHHDLTNVVFKKGRPNIAKIVEISCEESLGSTCFVTCGHPDMVDDIRDQVAQKVAVCPTRVDYFEQLQVWA
ncbi:hypothetical protein METBIDRAFT_58735 [Metschnikowia bicuspidata var. bicuspidata NRRL YB-4993]|uniref:FAD-binding FR-type domain-containing protein n=1 Tax=Metschnikowia bicuspidata var. bicuspidata NRRL YB-4993 TaxID=869754 RepID=A0A1A0H6Z0_9ASCO|nr:hypothetical protein METBIDRAFT_58735 [Metschnikowia bicuspidata var. bicuspidata NRRL YB-4993]OBA19864.1 hypothetical protein METBIDRAFT_58735 [Metschnikowia bicuspidata var. bicuspidata NRRL YB-4993]